MGNALQHFLLVSLFLQEGPQSRHHGPVHRAHALVVQAALTVKALYFRRVAEQLRTTPHKQLYCVLGFVRDKDLAHILPLLPRDAHYIFTQARTERALPAAELTAKAAIYGLQGESAPTVTEAVARARELAAPQDMIFIGGSTYVVAEAL